MQVIIDGDLYVKAPPQITESLSDIKVVLATPIEYENGIGTINSYLHDLLKTLWEKRECFSVKRPFGNSDWDWVLYTALAKAGIIEAELYEDGSIDNISKEEEEKADRLIAEAIDYIFFGSGYNQ